MCVESACSRAGAIAAGHLKVINLPHRIPVAGSDYAAGATARSISTDIPGHVIFVRLGRRIPTALTVVLILALSLC